jgi:hypothetical protein
MNAVMSAAEVIEMIKKLPPEERAAVAAYVKNEASEALPDERKIRYVSDEKFAEVAPKVFEKHQDLFRRLAQ